jgi:hypothetical protein
MKGHPIPALFEAALLDFPYIPNVFHRAIIKYITKTRSSALESGIIIEFIEHIKAASENPVYPLSWIQLVDGDVATIQTILASNNIEPSLSDVVKNFFLEIEQKDLIHAMSLLGGCPRFAKWLIG